MTESPQKNGTPVVSLRDVSLRYGKVQALDRISLEVRPGLLLGLIGPDGVGKSSLLSLVTGAHALQQGEIQVLGGDMRSQAHRTAVCPRIAYMPQGLGKNLYFTLTVEENLQFFARLFGHDAAERRRRIDKLTKCTGLFPFLNRPAGKLSGGMKQKLGLCCSLIHDPDLLVLDEPTTGVDPLARRQFWDLIDNIREEQPNMTVLAATAYMDEAQRFDWLVAMDGGHILDTGTADDFFRKTGKNNLDAAFIELLPEERRSGHTDLVVPPLVCDPEEGYAIEAEGLTQRFGTFTAVDHVSFKIRRGEIFGFLGSNGCGKTTTMRMLTGLLPATEGKALLFGKPVGDDSMAVRKNLGYMTQLFSLYVDLTVRQNLTLYARLYQIPESEVKARVAEVMDRYQLNDVAEVTPKSLPMGIRQRLSLAAAVIHHPKILILDEPTSGVDPVARDLFWSQIIDLSRKDKVTIFVTTHFMNEADRCDRISLMHAGKSLACDAPKRLVEERGKNTLEEAFIDYLESADPLAKEVNQMTADAPVEKPPVKHSALWDQINKFFNVQRWYSCCWRETLELMRDPIRATLALFGAILLMLVMGFGINLDVEHVKFAVLDQDQSKASQDYILSIAGSPLYFDERPPLKSYDEIDARMRKGDISMAVVIPPRFGQFVDDGKSPEVLFFIDGSMPIQANTMDNYAYSVHQQWCKDRVKSNPNLEKAGHGNTPKLELRNRYNPDVMSIPALVPGTIPMLLMMIPAVLAALAVVREKEQGSIINLYVTPLTKLEFVLGKQIPYLLFSILSALVMVVVAMTIFQLPVKGSALLLGISLVIYCFISTGVGLLASSVTRSQIAVLFMTLLGTMIPAQLFCGLINPVPSLDGGAKLIGTIYPTTYMMLLCRGVFNKALGIADLWQPFLILLAIAPVILFFGVILQKKQES